MYDKTVKYEVTADNTVSGSAAADDRMLRQLAVLALEGTSAREMGEVVTGAAAADKAQGGHTGMDNGAGMENGSQRCGKQHYGYARGICQVCSTSVSGAV